MTNITSQCFRHKKKEEITEMEVLEDGLLLTFKCGYKMKKFFDQ